MMTPGNAKKGLGAGLSALFGDELPETEENEVRMLPIAKLEPRENQPRAYFDDEALTELAQSISEYGLLQPITVRKLDSGYFQIIAGERRWRASRMARLTDVPVRVIKADEKLATELALVENLQREDLNPMEEARGYRVLIDEYGLTQDEAAQRVGKSRPAVTNAMRLLALPSEVAYMVENGILSAGDARALLPIPTAEAQLFAAREVARRGLSVRNTEELAKKLCKEPKHAPELPGGVQVDYLGDVAKRLEKSLGRKVKLSESGKRGKIVLEYYDADDRERLINLLDHLK